MGEVFRATDTRLRREVALKVLPDAVAADSLRMSRFAREAQVLAALNHPNIASIYGFEESSSTHALVMELVEGQTLQERIAQGPLPLDEALPIAHQIAEALEYAHDRGIVHRDLKPANIKIKSDGVVKVLDFGLAKALADDPASSDLANSPTLTAAATKAGLILGTAAYMAPEQARGRAVDRRADIWSFGVVVYEMLTGTMTFRGDTISDTLAAVIKTEPDWDALPRETPTSIRQMLLRCLHKESRQRLQSIGEARIAIDNARLQKDSPQPLAHVPAGHAVKKTSVLLPVTAGAALVLLIIGLIFLVSLSLRRGTPSDPKVVRFAVQPPAGATLVSSGNRAVALSPDGSKLVLSVSTSDGTRLFFRPLDGATATPIPGTEGGLNPFFSPDGNWLGFLANDKLKKVALEGGTPLPVGNLSILMNGISWGADHFIYYVASPSSPIMRIPETGGTAQEVTKMQPEKGERGHVAPEVLPDGKTLLYTVLTGGSRDEGMLVAQRLDNGERKTLISQGTSARFLPPNHLLYVSGGNLMAVEFDPRKLEVIGSAVTVMPDVAMLPDFGEAQFDVANNGTIAYLSGGKQSTENSLVWAEHDAKPQTLPVRPNLYESPRFSPDGKFLALTLRLPDPDIWIYDIERGTLRRVTFAPGEDELAIWSPDGKHLAFASNGRKQAFLIPADGSGHEEPLFANETHFHLQSWSPDGKLIAFEKLGNSGQWEIWMLPFEGDRKPYSYLASEFRYSNPAFSPDGHWLAYATNESGRMEVFVQRFPGPGEKVQVTADGGSHPVWSRDGRELIYEASGTLWAAEVTTSPTFHMGKSRVLYQGDIWHQGSGPNFALAPDKKHLAIVERVKDPRGDSVNLVLNWNVELQRLLAHNEK
jgi:eukaryotic-like serine/threonine-protein kinase